MICNVPSVTKGSELMDQSCAQRSTEDIADVIDKHRERSYFYADDIYIYATAACRYTNMSGMLIRLLEYAGDVSCSIADLRLQRIDQTEMTWFDTQQNSSGIFDQERSVQIG
jgi:hypothetical protein